MEITKRWSSSYGPVPDPVKTKLKGLHLNACTRTLGVDEVHQAEGGSIVLRSPGLRPGHWKIINKSGKFDGSVEAVFPDFMVADPAPPPPDALEEGSSDEGMSGVFTEGSFAKEANEDAGVDPNDALYESLAAPEPGEYDFCPRLVLKLGGGAEEDLQDEVLKVLLPLAARVNSIQDKDKRKAVEADEKRKKREAWEKENKGKTRKGYYY